MCNEDPEFRDILLPPAAAAPVRQQGYLNYFYNLFRGTKNTIKHKNKKQNHCNSYYQVNPPV